MKNRHLAVSACLVSFALPAPARDQSRFSFDATPGALSKDVVPSRYQLSFDVAPGRPDFSGDAVIDIRVRKPVTSIGIHAKELQATSAFLAGPDGSRRPLLVTPVAGDVGWRLETDPPATIPPGDYTLRISYSGKVQVAPEGLYAVPYQVKDQPAAMLATQLEPTAARMLFPGFDEPAFRASFEISVKAPARYEVVSNMPLARKVAGAESVVHHFQPTPPMPTYLVSIAIGRFDSLPGKTAGVPLRILTAEGRVEQARFALQATRQVIPFFTKYFGVPYALPKLDQLAVPAVRGGAMEDWGLISYAEDRLLFAPATSSPYTQRNVFYFVAHEISHQWFGNLVTAAWWDEIWLNEAFATWMAGKAMARFHPEWKPDLLNRVSMEPVMERDAGTSARPIRSGPVSESSVNEVFDDITYAKGGAVLSMLEVWIGPEAFRRGIGSYIRDRRLSNATAGDLWHHISRASGKDVAAVAASWTDQPGFPLVQVSSRCSGGRTEVTLKQRRFSVGPELLPAQTWKIPVRLSRGEEHETVMLEKPELSVVLPGCSKQPLVANGGGLGFYRVEYTAPDLERLTHAFPSLSSVDRVSLLGDTFALAQAGRVPMSSYFSILASLPTIRDGSRAKLHSMAFMALNFLDEAMAGTPAQASIRSAGRSLLSPTLAALGWEANPGEDTETTRLRSSLIWILAGFDDEAVVEKATSLFDSDVEGKARLPASTRWAVVQAVGSHSDRPHFDRLLASLKTAKGEEDRQMYARALASGRDPDRARECLAFSLAGELPSNLAASIPGLVGSASPNGVLAYEFTHGHWADLAALAGSNLGGQTWLLPTAASTFNEVSWARRLVEDQKAKAGPDGASPAQITATRIELLAFIRERDAAPLEKYLATWSPRR